MARFRNALSYSNLEVIDSSVPGPTHEYGYQIKSGGDGESSSRGDEKEVTAAEYGSSAPEFHPQYSTTPPEAVYPDQTEYRKNPPPDTTPRRRRLWIIIGVITAITIVAIGGGVGGYFASRQKQDPSAASSDKAATSTTPETPQAINQNLSIAALHWVDTSNISHYRVYFQPAHLNQTSILESAWDSVRQTWPVSIANGSVQTIQPSTPLAAVAGYPSTDTRFALVTDLFFFQPSGTTTEWQSPWQGQTGVWGNENASGLFAAIKSSSVFAYWHQDLFAKNQTLVAFFQEELCGANSLTAAWCFQERQFVQPWKSTRHSLFVQDGSSIAAASVGDGRDLRVYVGGTDGLMKQHKYDVETDVLGDIVDTPFPLPPKTPLAITLEDNRNRYPKGALPECTRPQIANAFLTHLLLFATPDRRSLTLASWNCSSGFLVQQERISHLLKPNRTYLGLASASGKASRNGTASLEGQMVFVLFREDNKGGGGTPRVEQWAVPESGGDGGVKEGQNGPWRMVGEVPIG